jgi:hypothetical protein
MGMKLFNNNQRGATMRQKILFMVVLFSALNVILATSTRGAEVIGKGVITGKNVNLRLQPDLSAGKITILNLGSEVGVLDQTNNWYKIRLGNGLEGWVFNHYLAKCYPTGSSRGNFLQVLDVSSFARHFLGLRYVYGGVAPAGFDCSGFTLYVYKHFGYVLPHNAAAQIQIGSEIDKKKLLPGDLVFFATSGAGKVSHVGIYLGAGQFIHASSPYSGVKINSLDDTYYNARYVGARRILAPPNENQNDESQLDATS